MKKISKIKLTQLSKAELEKREQQQLLGGCGECCGCGCNGPSSTKDNAEYNWNAGYSQSYSGEKWCACWNDNSHWGDAW